jgi:hypothetical protein
VIVQNHEGRGRIEARGFDLIHPGVSRHAVDLQEIRFEALPACAAVLRHVQPAIVRPHPEKSRLQRRGSDGGDGGEILGAAHVRRQAAALILVLPLRIVGRQVRTNRRPGVSTIGRFVDELAPEIERARREGVEGHAGHEIESQMRARGLRRLDLLDLPGP